jgi:hypothetical protein
MPIPLIIGLIALAVGAAGVGVGAAGVADMRRAKRLAEAAKRRHGRAVANYRAARRRMDRAAEAYGRRKAGIDRTTIRRMIAFLESLHKRVGRRLRADIEGVEVTIPTALQGFRQRLLDVELVTGGGKAITAGAATGAAAYGLIGLFGTASTGAAIGGLSGAAANSAVLAWLGGGSLAAGGGGMAVGAAVLGGIAVAPALLVGGFVLATKGEKALTQARRYEAKVDGKIARIEVAEAFIERVETRIAELADLVARLDRRARAALNALEAEPFDPSSREDLKRFQSAILLTHALSDVMSAPVLGSPNRLSTDGARVVAKYKGLVE